MSNKVATHRENDRDQRAQRTKKARYVETVVWSTVALALTAFAGPVLYGKLHHVFLLETGQSATATIMQLHDTGHRYNDHPEMRILLQLRGEAGDAYQISVDHVPPPFDRPGYEVGAVLDVRVDPEDRNEIAIAGLSASSGPPAR